MKEDAQDEIPSCKRREIMPARSMLDNRNEVYVGL